MQTASEKKSVVPPAYRDRATLKRDCQLKKDLQLPMMKLSGFVRKM